MSTRYQEASDKIGGLKGLLTTLGDGPPGDRWSSFKCPFCLKKSASVFKAKDGRAELFQCKHDDCVTGREAFNLVGYVGFKFGLATTPTEKGKASPAYERMLQLAGMWEDPSAHPPSSRRASRPAAPAEVESAADPTPPSESVEPDLSPPEPIQAGTAATTPSLDPQGVEPPEGGASFETSGPPGPPELPPDDGALFGEDPPDEDRETVSGGPVDPALEALRWFWMQTSLIQEDAERLWRDRGLNPDTCRTFGLRSNRESNLPLLREAAGKFGVEACVAAGLWEAGGRAGMDLGQGDDEPVRGAARPSEFFHGRGVTGEERGEDGRKRPTYGWNHAVLIPYFDFRLDPAKPQTASAVVTEGEFKAMALYQVLDGRPIQPDPNLLVAIRPHKLWAKNANPWFFMGPGGGPVAVGALPGVTFCKREGATWRVRYLLDTWLSGMGVQDVVVAYDNEDKARKRREARYDALVYGLWLAGDLCKDGFRGRMAMIPDGERDENGKADWDGVLAKAVGGRSPADWESIRSEIRTRWRGWLRTAVDLRQDDPVQIRWDDKVILREERGKRFFELPAVAMGKLKRLKYAYRMPVPGGTSGPGRLNTRRIARNLLALAREVEDGKRPHLGGEGVAAHLKMLGAAYFEVEGGYFACRPLKPKPDVQRPPRPHERDFWVTAMASATEAGDVDGAWGAEMALKGKPERFTDFIVEPHYKLKRISGEIVRVVTVTNRHGEETRQIELPGELYATPTRLREFLNKFSAGGTWRAGERELQEVQEDWNAAFAHRMVNQVCAWGWNPEAKAWFAEDCAIDANGIHTPNALGYYRLASGDWRVSDLDKEGRPYLHEKPKWHPKREAAPGEVAKILGEVMELTLLSVGSMHAHLSIGAVLAFAAAPEVVARYHAFPGLWIHGEPEQGKSTISRWLMQMVGFPGKQGGVSLESSSGPGVAITLQQIANLPVWLEEAQSDTRPELLRLLKDVFNRTAGAKALASGVREILTAPLVAGQSTSNDHATRTRYPHVLMASSRRLPCAGDTWDGRVLTESESKSLQHANYQRMNHELAQSLFLPFRHLLLNRERFAARVLELTAGWIAGPAMRGVEARAAMVRGVSLGGLQAALELCEVERWRHWTRVGNGAWESEMAERDTYMEMAFRPFLVEEARASIQELREQGEIETFLRALVTCFERRGFGEDFADWRRYFYVRKTDYCDPPGMTPGSAQAGTWTQTILYINPDATMDAIAQYLRGMGQTLRLRKEDLRAQMSARPWWERPPTESHKVRFVVAGVTSSRRYWALNLDLLPEFGFRPVSDAEYHAAMQSEGDPRRGPLHALADAIIRKSASNPND